MNKVLYILFSLILLLSCSTNKQVQNTTNSESNQISDVTTIREIIYQTDTVVVEIPAQTAERTTRDTTSTLENDFAISIARLLPDGFLFHSLNTKPRKLAVPFQKPIERTKQVATTSKELIKTQTLKIPVEVERKVSWWENFKLSSFWYLAAYGLAMSIWLGISTGVLGKATTKLFTLARRLV